jgi:hypothetical protein
LQTFATTAENNNPARCADHLTSAIDGLIIHTADYDPEFVESKLIEVAHNVFRVIWSSNP